MTPPRSIPDPKEPSHDRPRAPRPPRSAGPRRAPARPAARRAARRPRRAAAPLRAVRLAAGAALACALAVTAIVASGDRAPALAVERQDGWLVLRIADVAAGADALTGDLRAAGIAGEVRLLPVAPAEVGTWAVISERADTPGTAPRPLAPGPPETVRLDRVRYERETLRIPIAEVRESTGYFVFYAGREARAGEQPFSARAGLLEHDPLPAP